MALTCFAVVVAVEFLNTEKGTVVALNWSELAVAVTFFEVVVPLLDAAAGPSEVAGAYQKSVVTPTGKV